MADPATNLIKSGGNKASDTLSASVDTDDLALPLNSADEFDDNSMIVVVDEGTSSEEYMQVSGKSGSSLTVVTRGVLGTSAAGHDSGATVSAILTDWQWDQVIDAIDEEHDDDGKHTVDVISEKTAGSGVTIDGLLIKDGAPQYDGWTPDSNAWTASSWADTNGESTLVVAVPTGAASRYTAGDRVKFTQDATVKQGIITLVADEAITIFVNTDYTGTTNIITLPYYSHMKCPVGFDVNPGKWMVQTINTSTLSQVSATTGTYYNLGSLSITIPIGLWNVSYRALFQVNTSGTGVQEIMLTLSTTNNSESDSEWNNSYKFYGVNSSYKQTMEMSNTLELSTADVYYLNALTNIAAGSNSIYLIGGERPTTITATCAYL